MPRFRLVSLAVAVMAAGCASSDGSRTREVGEGVDAAATRTQEGIGDAILSPAEDLNIRRVEIPEVLKQIEHVYTPDTALTCELIEDEVIILTEVLGPDDDAPKPEDDEDNDGQRAGEEVGDATLGAVSGVASDFIPFRSLVRRATGATAHERRILAAFMKGQQRRSYLKGLGQTRGCSPPAAPLPADPEDARIVFRR